MAWYVTIRRKKEVDEKVNANTLLYVQHRDSTKNGYKYKTTPAIRNAKVFHSITTATEWKDDLILEDETAEVMSEVSQAKYAESRKSRLGKVRGKYYGNGH